MTTRQSQCRRQLPLGRYAPRDAPRRGGPAPHGDTLLHPAGNGAVSSLVAHTDHASWSAEMVVAAIARDGAALSPEVQRAMGRWFHEDFSGVRLHHGDAADQAARTLHADAFTVGNHIVLA